ncbi:general substrate transporter [Basidiobolus meristosporus CBS 931.73]|uniref:General substrate transporter n=1 Tax=Basidiobolus meristosporus CBS 931.73 TaxID=1314790 RepID=A0A1Y1YSY6_9FUNG|nr:general substrate transporter [Basidiobolus meristosporus CBS 931.73]|eukprot:ORY00934.1 general substrate transporter [Basidiobolus meristosporus CBS 931.73]
MKLKSYIEHEVVATTDSKDFGLSSYIVFCAFTCVLSSLSTGYHIGSPNTIEHVVSKCDPSSYPPSPLPACLPMGPSLWGLTVGIFALGCLLGALGAGAVADRLGRKKTLLLGNFFFIVAGILQGTAPNVIQLIVGRVIAGFGGGLACVLVPMYNSEISTHRYRGTLGVMMQLFIVVGILLSQALGLGLNSPPGWRILLGLSIAPAIIQTILLPFCTETPYWYIHKGYMEEGRNALKRLRPGCNIDREFQEIKNHGNSETSSNEENAESRNHHSMGVREILATPHVRGRFFNAIIVHIIQQLSGINGVIYYSSSIFRSSFGEDHAIHATVGVAALNVFMTVISSLVIDKVGRKPLLLVGDIIMCIFSILLVVGSVLHIDILMVVSVALFICGFAIGVGPIPWMITPELLPPAAVEAGSSVVTVVNWLVNFAFGFAFPPLQTVLHGWSFLPFSAITALAAVYIVIFVPETKTRKSSTV